MKEIIGSALETLKSNPLILALLVFNLIILGAIYIAAREGRTQLNHQMTLILERCLPK